MDTQGESFKSVCDAYIEELFKNSKTNYANMMRESEAHFLKFLRGDVRLVDITPELIEQYAAYLEKKNWSRATLGIVMRNTRTIINRAIKKRKVSYNVHPFVDYSIPQSPVRDVSIRLESLSKILNAEVDSNYLSVARDLFSLSFYLGGINMTDLMDMDRKKLYINFFGIIYIFTLITSEESRTASLMSASRNSVMSIIFCFLSVNSTS